MDYSDNYQGHIKSSFSSVRKHPTPASPNGKDINRQFTEKEITSKVVQLAGNANHTHKDILYPLK